MSSQKFYLVVASFFSLFFFAACASNKPAILFMISDQSPMTDEQELIWVERGGKRIEAKKKLTLKAGDRVVAKDGVDGLSLRTFQTISTAFGPSILKVDEQSLTQTEGTVLHEAGKSGTLSFPGHSVRHDKSSAFILEISDNVDKLTVLAGSVVLGSNEGDFPPMIVEAGEQRRVWKQSKLVSPSRPMKSVDLNNWITLANQLLTLAGDKGRLVPHLRGLAPDDAQGFLETAKLTWKEEFTTKGEPSDELGNISLQEPLGALRVRRSNLVTYDVRSVPVEVPQLIGLAGEAKVEEILQDVGLKIGVISESIEGVKVGEVTAQDPVWKEVIGKYGSVDVTIEVESVIVPLVVDMIPQAAQSKLRIAGLSGLTVRRTEYVEDTQGVTAEVRQKIEAEDCSANDSFKSGDPFTMTNPSIIALCEINKAVRLLELDDKRVYPRVSGQEKAGERVKLNTSIWVDIEVLGYRVPPIGNLNEEQYKNAIRKAGLTPGRISQVGVTGDRIGKVIRRDGEYASQSVLPPSIPVDFVVGIAPQTEAAQ